MAADHRQTDPVLADYIVNHLSDRATYCARVEIAY
jgi:hypothetical protein